MTKLSARFTNPTGSRLIIKAHNGKRGVNIAATLKTPGEQTKTGCRSQVVTEVEAKERFDALVADAVKQGWVEEKVVRKDRSAFTAIPPASVKASKKTAA